MPVHGQELHAADLLLLLGFLEVCLQHAQGNVPEVVHWKKKTQRELFSRAAGLQGKPAASTTLNKIKEKIITGGNPTRVFKLLLP